MEKIDDEYKPVNNGTMVKEVIGKGTYYAGVQAWNYTGEDEKKVFSPWSKVKKVKVK